MKASICMATFDKPNILRCVLDSIFRQRPPFDFEVIVVDDGSAANVSHECGRYPLQYHRIEREPSFRNPSAARNAAYRAAKGEVVICQSDDVVHVGDNCIERLVGNLSPGNFLIANVFNVNDEGATVPHNIDNPGYNPLTVYTGPTNQRPFFFLGSLYRKDLCAAGGNDEEFIAPGYDDDWFAACLMRGLELKPVFTTEIVGHHLHHKHFATEENVMPSQLLYRRKFTAASKKEIPWLASGGPWPYEPGKSVNELLNYL